ncbi:hypothetical protein NDU88_008871 [Pleurodeles waltl]|uniref:HECT domain-containing protein n=2 Tax=Pleurodeles waltl TaxID=8319 RepID=A0AAV7RUE4_PLEWA|nr:hypothetical protein NDU88_008871 [Pleurodeles waltl]
MNICYTELLIDNVQIPDEEEFDDSITNIAERNEVHESESNDITLKDLLSNLALPIDSEKTSKFNINRRNIWDGARRAFLRKTYKATNRISVMFTDSSGNSEGAVDFGGPTREFLRLLMHYLQHSKLFEGPENRKTLSCDAQGMRNDEYYLAGQAMAVSLVHGGPAPNFVSPVLYQCLVSDAKHVHSSLGDVVDPETQDMLKEIENASSLENLQGLIQKHSTVLSIAGCFRPLKSLNDKRELLEDLINWYIVGRTVPSLVRLKEGLKTLGVLQAMEIHKHIFEEAFVWMEQEITTDTINGMFNIKFSPSGSNYRIQEEHIIGYWRDYLQDCEGK